MPLHTLLLMKIQTGCGATGVTRKQCTFIAGNCVAGNCLHARCHACPQSTHLQVNARLAKVEAEHGGSSSGDPSVPKEQWPPAAACPKCRAPAAAAAEASAAAAEQAGDGGGGGGEAAFEWDQRAVFDFLWEAFGAPAPDAGASSPAAAGAWDIWLWLAVGCGAFGLYAAARSNRKPPGSSKTL